MGPGWVTPRVWPSADGGCHEAPVVIAPSSPLPPPARIGVVDLLTKKPTRSLNARITRPNYAAIMPQAIAVWAAQLGHEVRYLTYTGLEDLHGDLPMDADLVFLSGFTSSAYLACAISHLLRQQGAVTILGGPHARAFADDALHHFDYVCGFTDRQLVTDLLDDPAPHRDGGVYLSASGHPLELPGLRERWPYVEHNLAKSRLLHVVPMVSSLGCPFQLKRLRPSGFMGAIIGIESWFDFAGKTGNRGLTGAEKARVVGEQADLVTRYIPYVQANFIMGLDCDSGAEPFELSKRFLDRAPAIMPTYRVYYSFGSSSPLDRQLGGVS